MSNKDLMLHNNMMTSLVISDLLQHLTKNKVGTEMLINSKEYEIVKYIVAAIENNINNRGVVLKYLRALQNLKESNSEILSAQMASNNAINGLKSVRNRYQFMFDDMIDEIINNDE